MHMCCKSIHVLFMANQKVLDHFPFQVYIVRMSKCGKRYGLIFDRIFARYNICLYISTGETLELLVCV